MDVAVVEVLAALGGVATRAELEAVVSVPRLRAACAQGLVVRVARGRFALPAVDEASRVAHALHATVSFRSAAVAHGWGVQRLPARPDVTVARNRTLSRAQAAAATVHHSRLDLDDTVVLGGVRVTSTDRTLTDCLRGLPRGEALCVADSALRAGVTPGRLARLVRGLRGPGTPQARWVAEQATDLAANPFESTLRAHALEVPGLRVAPQVELWSEGVFLGRPDLVDTDHGVVLEADSFAWHGDRAALSHDCRRYDELVAAGWLVLRFSYEQVMLEGVWVRRILQQVTDQRTVRRPALR